MECFSYVIRRFLRQRESAGEKRKNHSEDQVAEQGRASTDFPEKYYWYSFECVRPKYRNLSSVIRTTENNHLTYLYHFVRRSWLILDTRGSGRVRRSWAVRSVLRAPAPADNDLSKHARKCIVLTEDATPKIRRKSRFATRRSCPTAVKSNVEYHWLRNQRFSKINGSFFMFKCPQGDGAFDFLAEEERASKHAQGRLDPGFNEQQMAVLEDTEVLVGQRDAEINNIGESAICAVESGEGGGICCIVLTGGEYNWSMEHNWWRILNCTRWQSIPGRYIRERRTVFLVFAALLGVWALAVVSIVSRDSAVVAVFPEPCRASDTLTMINWDVTLEDVFFWR